MGNKEQYLQTAVTLQHGTGVSRVHLGLNDAPVFNGRPSQLETDEEQFVLTGLWRSDHSFQLLGTHSMSEGVVEILGEPCLLWW